MSHAVPPSSTSTLDEIVQSLDWKDGAISGTQEAAIPAGVEAFKVAERLRELDPAAGYPCTKRGDSWYVIVMPDAPPESSAADRTQKSEPAHISVYCTTVSLYCAQFPRIQCDFTLYGPSNRYLAAVLRRMEQAVRPHLLVRHSAIGGVDFGDDYDPASPVNGLHPSWVDDGSNEHCMVQAVGLLYAHLRHIYPRNLPDNWQLAQQLGQVFKELPL